MPHRSLGPGSEASVGSATEGSCRKTELIPNRPTELTPEGCSAAWGEFDAWITPNRRTPAPDLWEYYVAGTETNPAPATYRTEFYRPLSD